MIENGFRGEPKEGIYNRYTPDSLELPWIQPDIIQAYLNPELIRFPSQTPYFLIRISK